MSNKNNITGIILAGGKSSRMGCDKGLMLLNNKPFITYIIEAMKPLVNDIIIVSNNSEYDVFNEKCIKDLIEDAGPLAGLYTGLFHTKTEINLVLSCDVPMIITSILETLLNPAYEYFDIVQLQNKDQTIPLIAMYKKQCVVTCKELLDQGERRLKEIAEHLILRL